MQALAAAPPVRKHVSPLPQASMLCAPASLSQQRVGCALARLLLAWLLLIGLSLLAPAAFAANPTVPQGGSAAFAKTGTDVPAASLTWDIVRAGSSVATSSAANGWSVTYDLTSTNFTVSAPAAAVIATNYEVRYTTGGGGSAPICYLTPRRSARYYAGSCLQQAKPAGTVGGGGTVSTSGISAFFDVTAAGPAKLSGLSVSPATVTGGAQSVGTVSLSGPAPTGGAVVTLSSNNAAASVPASVTVAAGQTSATFTITTQAVAASVAVTISAQYAGVTLTATLTVAPPTAVTLTGLSLSPASVAGGAQSVGMVSLSGAAPAGGAVVSLSSNNAAASVPASVTVAAGQTSATFTITTQAVAASTSVTISAQYAGTTKTATLTVAPAPTLTGLSLIPAGVTGGSTAQGTVTLSGAAPANMSVALSSSNSAATVPTSATVYQGQTQGYFTISTTAVASQTSGTITASLGGASFGKTFTVYPPQLDPDSGFSISPSTTIGGLNVTGYVQLTGPAPTGGMPVTITCRTSGAASAPSSVTIPAGQSGKSFAIATSTVNVVTVATLVATQQGSGGPTVPASVTLLPANLRVTAVIPMNTLRLVWDQPAQQSGSSYFLVRDGGLIATLPGSTTTYDDVFAGGFTSGQKYTYTLLAGTAYTTATRVDMEMVIPYCMTATDNQAVDSRLDMRYSTNVLLDHCFGTTTYKGGLFAGFASDPSKIGRSFARFAPTGGQPNNTGLRLGGVSAYCTGLDSNSGSSASVGCQIIPDPATAWTFSTLVWSQTDPATNAGNPQFSPSSAQNAVNMQAGTSGTAPGWQSWDLGSTFRARLLSNTPFTVVWAAASESTPGWVYLAKKEYQANLAPSATWAWSVPYPVSITAPDWNNAATAIPLGSQSGPNVFPVTISMHGIGKDDSVQATINGISVTLTGLTHTFMVACPYTTYAGPPASTTYRASVTCNGITASTSWTVTQ